MHHHQRYYGTLHIHETLTTTLGLLRNVNGISEVGEEGLALIRCSLGGGLSEFLRQV